MFAYRASVARFSYSSIDRESILSIGDTPVSIDMSIWHPPPPPVGGEWDSTTNLQLLTPWISLVSLMTMVKVSFVCVRCKRK